jgi:tellurite resistance protein TerC
MAVATELQAPWWVRGLFVAIVLVLLAVDLLLFRGERIGIRRSLWLTGGYIVAALIFGMGIFVVAGGDPALAFYTGYVLEKSLSLDNIFVFVVIFRTFRVPAEQQHRVLVWGVLSALVMRGLFIAAGVSLLRRYEWIMLIFGVLLVFSGGRLLLQGGLQESDPRQSRLYRFAERHLRVTKDFHGRHFFTRALLLASVVVPKHRRDGVLGDLIRFLDTRVAAR